MRVTFNSVKILLVAPPSVNNPHEAWARRRELFSHFAEDKKEDSEDEETFENIPEDLDNQLSIGFDAFCYS